MKYAELKAHLNKLTEEQLQTDVTVWTQSNDEFFQADVFQITNEEECDVFDQEQPIICILEDRRIERMRSPIA